MFRDNAFFVRECRQSRRTLHQAAWGSGVALLALLAVFVWLRLGPPRILATLVLRTDLGAYVLVGTHTLLCLGVGSLCRRVLSDEAREGTLSQLLLLPLTPGALLKHKLAFPLYWLALAWVAGWPFYLAAALTSIARMGVLTALYPLPFLAGLLCFIELANLPVQLELRKIRTGGSAREAYSLGRTFAVPLSVWALLACGSHDLLSGRPGGWSAQVPVYYTLLPRWLFWTLFGALCGALALQGGLAALTSESRATGNTRTINGVPWALYLLALGCFWPILQLWQRWTLLLGIPIGFYLLVFLVRMATPPRGEDPLAAKELAWAARLSDNPLYLRDLRSATRHLSMRRSLVRRACALALLLGGPLALLLGSGLGPFIPWDHVVLVTGVSLGAFLFWLPPVQASVAWAQEQPRGAVALLLMSPLTSAELVRGRSLAAVVHCWLVNGGLWLLILATFVYALARGYGAGVLPILAVSPLFISLLANTWSTDPASDNHSHTLLLALAQFATALSCLLLLVFAIRIPVLYVLFLSSALLVANYWLARQSYHRSICTLDRLRIEHLDAFTRTNQVT